MTSALDNNRGTQQLDHLLRQTQRGNWQEEMANADAAFKERFPEVALLGKITTTTLFLDVTARGVGQLANYAVTAASGSKNIGNSVGCAVRFGLEVPALYYLISEYVSEYRNQP